MDQPVQNEINVARVDEAVTGGVDVASEGALVTSEDAVLAEGAPIDAGHESVGPESNVEPQPLPAEPASDVPAALELSAILAALERMDADVRNLERQFESKLKYDQTKDRVIDSLHQELQQYRQGLHFVLLRPVLVDLIALYDDLGQIADSSAADAAESSAMQVMLRNLVSFQATVEEILWRQDVEAFTVEGHTFDGKRQRSIHVEPTSDKDQDRWVARRLRKGFAYQERVLRPEIVTTYRFAGDAAASPEATEVGAS